MACRNAYKTKTINTETDAVQTSVTAHAAEEKVSRLLFGVDSKVQANDLLQNNIEEFEWVVRNKIYPNFYGRYLIGENCISKEEINFLHTKGCKIAPIYVEECEKQTEEQGATLAKKIDVRAYELGIPEGTAVFLEIAEGENVSCEFMRGFASALLKEGYVPGFKANTDARFTFDREFSKGVQNNRDIFGMCLIWAVAPTVEEYNGMTTSHLIHPDNWVPYAPSGITRKEVAVWQYGKNCHPIEDDMGKATTFNLDLVRNERVIIDRMF